MPVSVIDWLRYFAVCMLIPAVAGYFCGGVNGAILISKYFFKEDVRSRGSGNAGLTNFFRNYGGRYAALVIVLDVLKMVAAVVIACLFMGWTVEAKLWGGLWCIVGHMFPALYQFKGGKGILSGGALALMVDWRVALVVWGGFVLLVLLTHYVSLGSVWAGSSFPFINWYCFPHQPVVIALSFVIGALVVWQHRSNIRRLLSGTENKLHLRRRKEGQA